jgi:NAD(P)-dependent dehydrogenase (short-subunit alcohol dehydrogenase family)
MGMLRGAIVTAGALYAGMKLARYARQLTYDFTGRVALITGGSRGLGLVLARHLAAHGARVAILARDQDELERAVADLGRRRVEVAGLECDVTSEPAVLDAVRQVADRFGRIDVLINNAGVIQVGPIDNMTLEDYRSAMDVHYWGPFYAMRAVLPHMRQQGEGRIVNICSIGGAVPFPHLAPYTGSKFALSGLSQAMQLELAREKIRVTTVYPGLMRTGSPPNAWFKGRHRQEYAWFAISDSTPLLSMSVDRAARKILAACQRGDAILVLTQAAKLGIIAHALSPQLVSGGLSLVNRLLPAPLGPEGHRAHRGRDSESALAPSLLTRLTDRAAERNNE